VILIAAAAAAAETPAARIRCPPGDGPMMKNRLNV